VLQLLAQSLNGDLLAGGLPALGLEGTGAILEEDPLPLSDSQRLRPIHLLLDSSLEARIYGSIVLRI